MMNELHSSHQVTEASLREIVSGYLGLRADDLDPDANLLMLGLDSMHLMAVLNQMRLDGINVTLRDLYHEPTLNAWNARSGNHNLEPTLQAVPSFPTMRSGVPFPLTPVQHAYFTGRSEGQVLGGVGCHLYQEFDGTDLNVRHLEQAIHTLIERHLMFRVVFLSDGTQRYQNETLWPGLAIHDLRDLDPADAEKYLDQLREQLSHRVLRVEEGETFDFQISLLPGGRHRLHVNLDLLVMDAASFTLLFEELAALLRGEYLSSPSQDYDFCSYIAHSKQINAAAREQARVYWEQRASSLPLPPALPLICKPEAVRHVQFERRRMRLDRLEWEAFSANAKQHGVTPTMALATCFVAVLSQWSGQERMLLNLTLFDRELLHPAVESMIADFTNILLLEMSGDGAPFKAMAIQNQMEFLAAHQHRHWSGVELLRTLHRNETHPYGAPVVFTSNLHRALYGEGTATAIGEPGWGASQTPQVWLDYLAFKHEDSIILQWDSNNALFPDGLLEAMFDAYKAFVSRLAGEADAWLEVVPDLRPQSQKEIRTLVNSTGAPLPEGLLHEGIFAIAAQQPEVVALIQGERRLTYGTLVDMASRIAGTLTGQGVRPGDLVAVSMSRGIGQVVALLGILAAGGVYVPVSLEQPPERRRQIYKGAGIGVVLVCAHDKDSILPQANEVKQWLRWQEATAHQPVETYCAIQPDAPAYVIYTSGSTGVPKGVVISHRSALNTCVAINDRIKCERHDRALGLSALHFDLSVYDIFGVLSVGAALVLLEEAQRLDPAAWCRLIDKHNITLWNSVPALFDMLLTYAEGLETNEPGLLRQVMLSGDWIGLDLAGRYRVFRPDGALLAMGGATEASIWSNAFDVVDVMPEWRSIPYGFPLPNQRYRVVSMAGRDCPDWVQGELWIGGAGVATGYLNDSERSAQQFLEIDGERWYRTGDYGCYRPDGALFFFGRKDTQVKIGGYRIELGEINIALSRISGVIRGVVLVTGVREKTLVAFVVAGKELCIRLDADPYYPSHYKDLIPSRVLTTETDSASLDQLIASFLLSNLHYAGVDLTLPLLEEAVIRAYGAQDDFHNLIRRWLAHLRRCGFVDTSRHVSHEVLTSAEAINQPEGSNPALSSLSETLDTHHEMLISILRGEIPRETLLDHTVLAPDRLLLGTAGMSASLEVIAHVIKAIHASVNRPVRVVEYGMRTGLGAEMLLCQLDSTHVHYTGLETSQAFVLRAREHLAHFDDVSIRHVTDEIDDYLRFGADVVWANNVLHRVGPSAITDLMRIAAPGALIVIMEMAQSSAFSLISADLFGTDEGSTERGLRDKESWLETLSAAGLECEKTSRIGDHNLFILRTSPQAYIPNAGLVRDALARELPSYMVPRQIRFLDCMPLTPNGKIDRQMLLDSVTSPVSLTEKGHDKPQGAVENTLSDLWKELLGKQVVHRQSHFFQLGGDSLSATRLIGRLHEAGYSAQLRALFDYPTLAGFALTLKPSVAPQPVSLQCDENARYEPFPLTEVQQAYLVGRQPGFPLGGVGSHFFIVFEIESLDVLRLEKAVNRLISRHDMLRAVVRNGQQQVLAEVPAFALPVHLVPHIDGSEAHVLFDRLARQVLDPSIWPVFDFRVLSDGIRSNFCVCLDNLFLDGMSMQILFEEIERLYLEPDAELVPLAINFRDYVMEASENPESESSVRYWKRRLATLPPAPRLQLVCEPAEVGVPRFIRLSSQLDSDLWEALKNKATNAGLTASGVLLAAYAATLSAWSTCRDLTINLTLFDRKPVHAQIEQILGDFTSLTLLAWKPEASWRDSARHIQQRLWHDLTHREISALKVMRDLATRSQDVMTQMPVVFTSALGFEGKRFLAQSSCMKPLWGLSQTPQVWLDHQVYESEGELRFNWDAVEALFEPEQLTCMFDQYQQLLIRLAREPDAWNLALEELVPRQVGLEEKLSGIIAAKPNFRDDKTSKDHVDFILEISHGFKEITGLDIGTRQNFFDAGASSLDLVRFHVHLQKSGHIMLQVTDLFANPTPRALSEFLVKINTSSVMSDIPRKSKGATRRHYRKRIRNEGT